MVVKMMKWSPWPPLSSKKFEAKIVVRSLQGLEKTTTAYDGDFSRLAVEVKWKGSGKSNNPLNFKRSSVKRNLTKEGSLNDDGVVEWNEEFVAVCNLVGLKDGCFHQWEVAFKVFDGLNQGPKRPDNVVATGSLNLAEFASAEQEKTAISTNLLVPSNTDCNPILSVSLSLLELRTAHEVNKVFWIISTNRAKKVYREEESSDGKSSGANYPFDTDSLDGTDGVDSEEVDYADSNIRKSFSYETLAYANHVGGLSCSSSSGSEDEDWIFYRNYKEKGDDSRVSVIDRSETRILKRSIFPWRKRKLGFRSPKAKGEPLLRKDFGEGGDDIDFDRRMLSSSDDSTYGPHKNNEGSTTSRSSTSEFGDDNFTIGKWENKEIKSRDGHMTLKTQVFFASIDQRSEKASGQSACTTLVATIANWLQNNQHEMPIKSQLDTLIHEGSLEWRNLCENENFQKRFPDKHFDLETVLQAKARNLVLVPEKSFIGFFKGLEEGVSFDFLDGAMSFDAIWDEISQNTNPPLVYIVSWNDHFFVLKVERDAYYIIDTLGERLYEGCDQAYVLKFDKDTEIQRITNKINEKTQVWKGKEACKEYIKRFLAEIPIRELQADLKKGLMAESAPLVHHRLQIEFHYTNTV